MNGTNRVLNRLLLVVTGGVLAVAGLVATSPWALPGTRAAQDDVVGAVQRFLDRMTTWRVDLGARGSVPWALVLVPVAALVVVVLLGLFVFAQGRGRIRDVVREPSTEDAAPGSLAVDVDVASAVIGGALDARGGTRGVRVAAYRVKGAPAMKVTVAARKGTDVEALVDHTVQAVEEWDALLGRRVPVLVHLVRGS